MNTVLHADFGDLQICRVDDLKHYLIPGTPVVLLDVNGVPQRRGMIIRVRPECHDAQVITRDLYGPVPPRWDQSWTSIEFIRMDLSVLRAQNELYEWTRYLIENPDAA